MIRKRFRKIIVFALLFIDMTIDIRSNTVERFGRQGLELPWNGDVDVLLAENLGHRRFSDPFDVGSFFQLLI